MLAQLLRCWPHIEPTSAECTLAVLSIHICSVNCFAIPAVIKSVSLQPEGKLRTVSLGGTTNSYVAQVYGFTMIWELAWDGQV